MDPDHSSSGDDKALQRAAVPAAPCGGSRRRRGSCCAAAGGARFGPAPEHPLYDEAPCLPKRLKSLLSGKPRDLGGTSVFTHLSLVAFLAWVGLGADGLSSTCYGPAEAFANLGEDRYLAVFLAAAFVTTVSIISACYSHIIEEFPSGGGGYLVASKLLGRRVGVLSGSAAAGGLRADWLRTTASC